MHKSGLTELEVVLAVARRKSFRAAASDLDMSATAVSNAVANLETRLGVRLFHRSTRSVSLTQAGDQFVSQIEPAVASIQNAMTTAAEHKSIPEGTLRLNSSLGAALMIFEPIMLKFLQRYPGMTLDISTDGKLVDIIAEGFDAGIRVSQRVPQDMIRVPLTREVRLAVVGTPAYFQNHQKPLTPDDLRDHICVRARLPSGVPSPWEFRLQGAPTPVHVTGQLVMDAPLLMLEAVKQGAGLAQLPEWYIAREIKEGKLVKVLEEWTSPAPGFSLYYSGRRHIPYGLRALIDLIQQENGSVL